MDWTKANQEPEVDLTSFLSGKEENFEKFLCFAAERMDIYWRRAEGQPAPWTDDPILQQFKFTNCYRILDKTSQYLIKNISNAENKRPFTCFGQTYLFKMFNKIETWEALPEELKYPVGPGESWLYDEIAHWAATYNLHTPLYNNAYLMCPPDGVRYPTRTELYLATLCELCNNDSWSRIMASTELCMPFLLLRAHRGFGDFLAYQFAMDFCYGVEHTVDFNSFVVPGPGCRRGMQKVFGEIEIKRMPAILKALYNNQKELFEAFDITFRWLGHCGRTWLLQVNDFQNLFCEFDKYSRVAYPELTAKSCKHKIKNTFTPTAAIETYHVPRNWL